MAEQELGVPAQGFACAVIEFQIKSLPPHRRDICPDGTEAAALIQKMIAEKVLPMLAKPLQPS